MLPADQPILMSNNKGFRYGDGVFETIRVYQGAMPLFDYHMDRFFSSFLTLGYENPPSFNRDQLKDSILSVCKENNTYGHGRVRLTAFGGDGGPNDKNDEIHYLIESSPLDSSINTLNENGLIAGISREALKSCDTLANLKSANFLPYLMAARFARQAKWDEALVMNIHQRIADATIANVFIIKGKQIFTPPLNEGPVNGVMRRLLLEKLPEHKYSIEEKQLDFPEVYEADEVFLTNAISGIRWVGKIDEKTYGNTRTKEIYQKLIRTIWT